MVPPKKLLKLFILSNVPFSDFNISTIGHFMSFVALVMVPIEIWSKIVIQITARVNRTKSLKTNSYCLHEKFNNKRAIRSFTWQKIILRIIQKYFENLIPKTKNSTALTENTSTSTNYISTGDNAILIKLLCDIFESVYKMLSQWDFFKSMRLFFNRYR